MGRCIDADEVIEQLEKVKKESTSLVDVAHIIGFQSLIDSQPTAYDPDKVVEQLEDCSMWKRLLVYELTHREREIVKRAIEIVKGGGKNADTKRGKRKN